MADLEYQGPLTTGSASTELATRKYGSDKLPGLSTTAVDDRINAGLAAQVLKSYVDTQDALNATAAYMNAGDATRLKTADKDVANGVLALGVTGKALSSRFNVSTTQRWGAGIWTPSAYGSVSAVAAETGVWSMPITDPGFTYKLLVFGVVEATADTVGQYPVITVRQGNATTGTVIATGNGTTDSYNLPTVYSDAFPGSTLDSAKWGTIAGTGRSNITVTSGAVVPASGSTQMSQWVGQQPTTDKLSIKWKVTAVSFGASLAYGFANTAWTNWLAVKMTRLSFGASAEFYSGTALPGQSPAPVQRDVFNIGASPGNFSNLDLCELTYDPTLNKFQWSLNGVNKLNWTDSGNVIGHGAGHRVAALQTNSDAGSGGNVGMGYDDFSMTELGTNPSVSSVNMVPINYASQSAITGATTLFVRANRSGSTGAMSTTAVNPKLVAFAIPA